MLSSVQKPTKMANDKVKNHNYCLDTLKAKADIERGFLVVGERLYTIRKGELFKPHWESFYEFELEFKWSPGTANKLINIYKKFVLEHKISPDRLVEAGGWSALAEVLPVVKTKKDAEHWLDQAKELTRDDLRKEVSESRNGVSKQDACQHPDDDVYYLRICRNCGLKEEVYPEDGVITVPHHHG